jgi:4a-hydroxytetrahydrobiopterin dehydratase
MASDLARKKCVPCARGTPPLRGAELEALLHNLAGHWRVEDEHHLEKEYRFRDFREALAFTNHVGAIAEAEGHHPDIELSWGRVVLRIHTHVIDGLSEGDFVLAAKADAAFEEAAWGDL